MMSITALSAASLSAFVLPLPYVGRSVSASKGITVGFTGASSMVPIFSSDMPQSAPVFTWGSHLLVLELSTGYGVLYLVNRVLYSFSYVLTGSFTALRYSAYMLRSDAAVG